MHALNDFVRVYSAIKKQFSGREDSEHEQAFIRIGIGIVVLLYFLFIWNSDSEKVGISAIKFIYVMVAFIAASISLVIHIAYYPSIFPKRRIVSIVLDIGTITYFFFNADEHALPLYFLYLWVTFGNGFRYGRRYLIFALLLALSGFGVAILSLPYWQRNQFLGGGLWVGMLLVSLYVNALVGRMTAALDRAEIANQAKRHFISSVSHELRTPLNAIIGMAELLRSTSLNSEQKGMLHSLDNASKVMLSLIEDVLDFSKIEAGKLIIESTDFDLYQVIVSTVDVFKHLASERAIKLIVNIDSNVPYELYGDPHHLRQVLVNLLSNAIKFTKAGHVILRIESLSVDEKCAQLHFEIEDTGIGISKEAQGKIFESFTQAEESTTRRYGGTGLGTTISKQLIELMGGKIGLQSTLGVGSNFWFELTFDRQELNQQPLNIENRINIFLVGLDSAEEKHIEEILQGLNVTYKSAPNIELACVLLEQVEQSDTSLQMILISTDFWGAMVNNQSMLLESLSHPVKKLRRATCCSTAVILCNKGHISKEEKRKLLKLEGVTGLLDFPIERSQLENIVRVADLSVHAASQEAAVSELKEEIIRSERNFNILVAEDNQTNRKVIQKILERAGHSCTLVHNGEEALDEIGKQDYDAIVLDMNMPVMGGVEMAKVYRFMYPADMRVPIIVFSANVTIDAKKECFEAGVDAFLPKPIQINTLLGTINDLAKEKGTKKNKEHNFLGSSMKGFRPVSVQPQLERVVLNYATLSELESIGQDPAFVSGLFAGFSEDTKRLMEILEDALSCQRFEESREILHAMKGSAISIGAISLKHVCQEFERMTHSQLKQSAATVVQEIRSGLKELSNAFSEYSNQRYS